MTSKPFLSTIVAMLSAMSVCAEPEIYFGEDVSPYPFGPNDPNQVPRINATNSLRVAAEFRARLRGAAAESFESFEPGSSPSTVVFGTSTAGFEGDRVVWEVTDPASTRSGTFPSSGTRFAVLYPGDFPTTGTVFLRVAFSAPQSAFGFFGTDFEQNRFELVLTGTNGLSRAIPVPVTLPQGSGGACYFGVIDKADPFVSVEFRNVGSWTDGFGFDDMTIGTPDQVLPAPADLQLAMYPGLTLRGTVGSTYRIEFADSLPSTNWMALTNLVLPSSPYFHVDLTATNRQARYYRAPAIP